MDVQHEIDELKAAQNMLALFTGQALALLAGEDPIKASALDDFITHFDAIVEREGSKRVMGAVRDGADKMLAASRRAFPGYERDPS